MADPWTGKKAGDFDKSVLEGRWFGDFSEGTDPDLWVSSIDILNIWKKTGKPTKYGQCWVFAAVQTTMVNDINTYIYI